MQLAWTLARSRHLVPHQLSARQGTALVAKASYQDRPQAACGESRPIELKQGYPREQPTVGARKLEYDHPPTPKPREEGKTSQIVLCPYSNLLESTYTVA